MRLYWLLAFYISVSLLLGCATRPVQTLANLPLPADQTQNCCWQALQELDITYDKQNYKLTAALAQTPAGVTLVLLDPFGRRLLSVNKFGETITRYRSPELPQDLPEHFLLASSILVWWPIAEWHSVLASAQTGWQISVNSSERLLSYRGKAIVSARYEPDSSALIHGINSAAIGQLVTLQHRRQPLAIKVVTQSFNRLNEAPKQ